MSTVKRLLIILFVCVSEDIFLHHEWLFEMISLRHVIQRLLHIICTHTVALTGHDLTPNLNIGTWCWWYLFHLWQHVVIISRFVAFNMNLKKGSNRYRYFVIKKDSAFITFDGSILNVIMYYLNGCLVLKEKKVE